MRRRRRVCVRGAECIGADSAEGASMQLRSSQCFNKNIEFNNYSTFMTFLMFNKGLAARAPAFKARRLVAAPGTLSSPRSAPRPVCARRPPARKRPSLGLVVN